MNVKEIFHFLVLVLGRKNLPYRHLPRHVEQNAPVGFPHAREQSPELLPEVDFFAGGAPHDLARELLGLRCFRCHFRLSFATAFSVVIMVINAPPTETRSTSVLILGVPDAHPGSRRRLPPGSGSLENGARRRDATETLSGPGKIPREQ